MSIRNDCAKSTARFIHAAEFSSEKKSDTTKVPLGSKADDGLI